MPNLKSLISDFAAAQNADNLTMQAIKQSFVTPSKETATSILPFSPAWKYSAVSFGERHYVLGAPELILRDEYDQVKNLVENYSADGNRSAEPSPRSPCSCCQIRSERTRERPSGTLLNRAYRSR